MPQYFTYWVRLNTHTDRYTEGYIGVTNNPIRRMYMHRWNKMGPVYPYVQVGVVLEILHEGTQDECHDWERHYRPTPNVGWNVYPGGSFGNALAGMSKPASQRRRMSEAARGRAKSPEHRAALSKASKNRKRLTADQVTKIRERLATGTETMKAIATDFGISDAMVSEIKHGKYWNKIA